MTSKKLILSAVIVGSVFVACNRDRQEGDTTYAPSSTATPRGTGANESTTSGSTTTGSSMGTDVQNNNEDETPTPTPKKQMGPASGQETQ